MSTPIAVLGLACELPGASNPEDLWDTALHQRRWFRNLPSQRLPMEYIDPSGDLADSTRLRRAAVLEGYRLPLDQFALKKNEARTADFTHWLALDCATRAIKDAGLDEHLPRHATSVIVGNTLAGESSRADLLRLRWPFFRRKMEESGYQPSEAEWRKHELHFKSSLAPVEGRTLAGALSNVIAGRIAQHHHLQGGCYCVDAACASSLIAIAQACSQLASGEIECAVVGGVDVSLDPLELVGFSKAGALCDGEMKVFDVNRSGFIPGEGCGFAVLMRADHPAAKHGHVRALLSGWGISSDGYHHLTAPSPDGQRLALERAYRRAGFSISTVPLFEAHGTGTDIGDRVEVSTLIHSLNGTRTASAVGSIKANIGHTKAAAGMAGMIKAIQALQARVLPPTTGCDEPMHELRDTKALRVLHSAEAWPSNAPLRAGVSGFGFGGVNAHIVLEAASAAPARITIPTARYSRPQEELFVFSGTDLAELIAKVRCASEQAPHLADAQFPSLAQALAQSSPCGNFRAAVVASDADGLSHYLSHMLDRLVRGERLIDDSPLFVGIAVSDSTQRVTDSNTLAEIATAYVGGAMLPDLHQGRLLKPFNLNWTPHFFVNPCEAVTTEFDSQLDKLGTVDAIVHVIRGLPGATLSNSEIDPAETLEALGVDSLDTTGLALGLEKIGYKVPGFVLLNQTVSQLAARLTPLAPNSEALPQSVRESSFIRGYDIIWQAAEWLETQNGARLDDNVTKPLVVSCMSEPDARFFECLLNSLRASPKGAPVVFLDCTGHLGGFAKTYALEHPGRRVRLIHHDVNFTLTPEQLATELSSPHDFGEVRYSADGMRHLPFTVSTLLTPPEPEHTPPIGAKDVVLVTGGGKGITAACAKRLAEVTGATLALLGRSSTADPEVRDTLQMLTEAGVTHRYWTVDISDTAALAKTVVAIEAEQGTVTAIIHGAGINIPRPIASLTVAEIAEHRQAKVDGLRHLLEILPASQLKLVVVFGSIIARSGYRDSAAYAFANDQLACVLATYQDRNPHVRCQVQDWTAWAEIGMARKLHAVEQLQSAGLELLEPDAGTAAFLQLLHQPNVPARVIVAPALPALPTLPQPVQPPRLEGWPSATILAYTPHTELAVEVNLSLGEHPWLSAHAIKKGQVILPGMLALDIMEQVAATLAPGQNFPSVEDIRFTRPIHLSGQTALSVTIHARFLPDGSIHCQLSETANTSASPSVSASFSRDAGEHPVTPPIQEDIAREDGITLAAQVYEHLLFHRDRFQNIARYSHASASAATFHLHEPQPDESSLRQRVLTRDALIHGIQVCVPGELLLPSRILRVKRNQPIIGACTVAAQESLPPVDGTFVYDLAAFDPSGELVEQWQGLELKRYTLHPTPDTLPTALATIHRQRQPEPAPPRYFEYRHTVGFKETNVVGNVYFTNHLEWQGRCRELFLKTHAPELLADLESGTLALVTVSCSCEYHAEVRAFDEIAIRMTLEALGPDTAIMRFDYWCIHPDAREDHIATGTQKIASRRRAPFGLAPTPLPPCLVTALQPFLINAH